MSTDVDVDVDVDSNKDNINIAVVLERSLVLVDSNGEQKKAKDNGDGVDIVSSETANTTRL